jgi:hypothetical protein
MVKNNTRRNKKTEGGAGSCGMKLAGGKRRKSARKTRKMSKGADTWREGVMRVYKEMKAKNANTKFGDALKEASKRKKAGKL